MKHQLQALNPLDGRYAQKMESFRSCFNEQALIRYRVQIEIEWFIHLAEHPQIKELPDFHPEQKQQLRAIYQTFGSLEAEEIKEIEKTTNHDVKAVEYFVKHQIKQRLPAYKTYLEFVHFACTSEDINNLSYALMLQEARKDHLLPIVQNIIHALTQLAVDQADQPMLARTHGQPASPTTLGKEMNNFAYRLARQRDQIKAIPILGKMNGATGNFNAHHVAYPAINWLETSQHFIAQLQLDYNPLTTQIEPHDYMAELFQAVIRCNTVLLDFCRDIWGYISLGYFKQKTIAGEIGSSTMPHKINPIDFENAEGNLGLSNALLSHLSEKLPISRWQRDLTDSTVLRNLGVSLGYAWLAYQSMLQGIGKLEVSKKAMMDDLQQNHEILAEAVQTVMRRYGMEEPYEQLKNFTRGKKIDQNALHAFIDQLSIQEPVKNQLKQLQPENYTGYASQLARKSWYSS